MGKPAFNRIRLTDTNKNRECALSFRSDDLAAIELFKGLCKLNLSPGLNWVHQINLPQHQQFVFRSPHIEVIKSAATAVATVMEMPLEIQLTGTYKSTRPIMVLPFRPFDPSQHEFHQFTFTRGIVPPQDESAS